MVADALPGCCSATDGSVISKVPLMPELMWKFEVLYVPTKVISATAVPPLETVSTPPVLEPLAL